MLLSVVITAGQDPDGTFTVLNSMYLDSFVWVQQR